MFDLIIIGGGPAGTAASVYAARKRLKTLQITAEFGGQSTVSVDIQNWIGTPHISGMDMAKTFEAHVREYSDEYVQILSGQKATAITKLASGGFSVLTESGATHESETILIATGADRKKLTVPGAEQFEHKGVVYCASCDGPLFSGMDTVVIGGGNAGFETAAQLLAYATSVTLLQHNDTLKADQMTIDNVCKDPKMTLITNAKITKVVGDAMVTGVEYEDVTTGDTRLLPAGGVFVEIGMIPNTTLAQGVVEMDDIKRIKVNAKNQRTSVDGIWAAGDCTDELYHQNNIAAGDGVKALEDIYMYVKTR